VLDAAQVAPAARLGAGAVLKVYVRRSEDAELARTLLHEKLPQRASTLLLQGDICRSELLVEIDGVQDA
jgi:chorismate lyase/3-hydroxybenzoate synthase